VRTFSRADWIAAQQAWDDGEFSEEWRTIRHQAALNGILYPPRGGRFDCWDDERPSQRAMLIRAIRETPLLLEQSVTGSRSWSQVLDKLLAARDKQRRKVVTA